MNLTEGQRSRLKEVIQEFPELKQIAWKFNQAGISWGIAAGTAAYIYTGKNELDDVDLWIASEDKLVVSEVLEEEWQTQLSERHQAENIYFGEVDIFTNCRKVRMEEVLLDYRMTEAVSEQLRLATLGGVDYKIISPEDIVVLKMVNPREADKKDVVELEKMGLDKKYLRLRLSECGVTIMVDQP